VIIVALWGTVRPILWHPEALLFRAVLQRWSHLASEVVPGQYAKQLNVPAVFVNQGGITHLPLPAPRFWPLPSLQDIEFDFWGSSHVRNALGEVLVRAGDADTDFYSVVSVDVRQADERPRVTRADISPQYLNADYYFVQPPLLAKLFQEWSFRGFTGEYEARRTRQSGQKPGGGLKS